MMHARLSPAMPTRPRITSPTAIRAMKNALIATISTYLSHYFTPAFLQSGWLADYASPARDNHDPEAIARRVLEMKTRFLYCLKIAIERLAKYQGQFVALSAFQEDTITDTLEIISTPEREFHDALLNRCTEVMVTDLSGVRLSEAICGQFLHYVLRLLRQKINNPEHLKYLYLFCVWKMPEVLFEPSAGQMLRQREVHAILNDARLPYDLLEALRHVRGGGIFPHVPAEEEPVDEGWDLEYSRMPRKPSKRWAWWRFFSRSERRKAFSAVEAT